MVCNPAGETHSLHFSDQAAHSIVIEIDTAALSKATGLASTFDRANVWHNQFTASWGLKLHRALTDAAEDGGALEDAVFEVLAPLFDEPENPAFAPSWLKQARDFLRDCPEACDTISSLALNAGVDAAHFAREFRRYYRVTASEYRLHSRLDRACRALVESGATPAEAAFLAGFSDQSHFGRVLKSYARLTPSMARAILMLGEPQHQGCSSH